MVLKSNNPLCICSLSNDVIDEGVKSILEDHFADENSDDDDDDLSFDSNITDRTWKIDFSDVEDENDDYQSLDTTPTNNNDVTEIVPVVNNISVDSFDEVKRKNAY